MKTRFAVTVRTKDNRRAITLQGSTWDTEAEAQKTLQAFLDGGDLPKIFLLWQIESLRVDPVTCYDNGQPVHPFLSSAIQYGPRYCGNCKHRPVGLKDDTCHVRCDRAGGTVFFYWCCEEFWEPKE